MTTRQFDPVFSAALRNELEALADAPAREVTRRHVLRRPQVWVTALTALVLVAATLGVLQLTERNGSPPAGGRGISDPLSQITDAGDAEYVGESPLVLLQTSGTGSGTSSIDVPTGVTSVRPYLRCAPIASFRVAIGKGFSTGCDARTADYGDIPVTAGRRDLTVRIPAGVAWRLVVIATPDDSTTTSSTLRVTTSPDSIADPLTEVTDPTSEMYVASDVQPILHERASRSRTFPLTVPPGVAELRTYLVCRSGARWTIGDETGTCRGRINGYSDVAASDAGSSMRVTVPEGTPYVLLVIPTPTDTAPPVGPAVALPRLAYPTDAGRGGTLVGRARGTTTARTTGDLRTAVGTLLVVTTCEGSGTLVIRTSDGSTSGAASESPNPAVCTPGTPKRSTFDISAQGGLQKDGALRYSIDPVGSVTWTVSFYDAG